MDNLACTACGSIAPVQENRRLNEQSVKMKNNLVSRLNKIEGQVRGVKRLVDENTYCDDVLNQIASVQSALNSVGKLILEAHLKTCIAGRIKNDDMDAVDELMETMKKLIR